MFFSEREIHYKADFGNSYTVFNENLNGKVKVVNRKSSVVFKTVRRSRLWGLLYDGSQATSRHSAREVRQSRHSLQSFSTFKFKWAKCLTLYSQAPLSVLAHKHSPVLSDPATPGAARAKAVSFFFSSLDVTYDSWHLLPDCGDLHMVTCAASEVVLCLENHGFNIHEPYAVGKLFHFCVPQFTHL